MFCVHLHCIVMIMFNLSQILPSHNLKLLYFFILKYKVFHTFDVEGKGLIFNILSENLYLHS